MSDTKVKGIVDIVVLLDTSGSMQECIDGVKTCIGSFVNGLEAKGANNESPIKDWRMKVCGYKDHEADGENWFSDNPFVSDVASVQAQIAAANMQASGGGDEPESLLDALFKIAKMEQSGVQEGADPNKWRARGTIARAVIFFTDATFKDPMTIPEAAGGGLQDAKNAITGAKILLFGFCPETDNYCMLGCIGRSLLDFYVSPDTCPAVAGLGKGGEEGNAAAQAAVEALASISSDRAGFTKIMEQLAKTLSASVHTELA